MEDGTGVPGGKQVDQGSSLLLSLILRLYCSVLHGGTQHGTGDCSRRAEPYSASSFTWYETHFIQALQTSL